MLRPGTALSAADIMSVQTNNSESLGGEYCYPLSECQVLKDSYPETSAAAELADEGRLAYQNGDLEGACESFARALYYRPEWWWLRTEYLRASQKISPSGARYDRRHIECVFSPNYSGNPYQEILHRNFSGDWKTQRALDANEVSSLPELTRDRLPGSTVFHQHWVREIYRGLEWTETGRCAIDVYFGHLRAAQTFGARVVWTVHNLVDHDLTEDEVNLNIYALKSCASVADLILVHNQTTLRDLNKLVGSDFDAKARVLEHPLYDSDRHITPSCPKRWPSTLNSKERASFIFLMFGMIRPYKGAGDLLQAFRNAKENGALGDAKLIVAGRVYDDQVWAQLESSGGWTEDVVVLDERVSAPELAWLCRNADAAVLPYRAILTSGSYYHAVTFELPVVVPEIGMFAEVVSDGSTAITYSKRKGLQRALEDTFSMKPAALKQIGKRAYTACQTQTEAATAHRYHSVITELMEGKTHADS